MYLSRALNRSLAPPDRVSLNVTLRCNLTCTMCTTCYDAPELSTDEVKSIIDQTAAWGVEVFNPLGGEPFMRGDIEEILAYAVRRGFYVTVTTNGTLITERRARALAAIPSDRLHLNISLDGDAQANDLIRGAGMWQRAIQGYRRVRAADAEAGNARRKVLANTILHARNIDRFEAILDEQAALGFDGVQILTLFRSDPTEAPPESAALWFGAESLPKLRELSEALAQRAESQPPSGYQIQNSPDELRRVPRYYDGEMQPLEAPCWAGWKELYINADGRAVMCDGKLDFLAGSFGDVRKQTLRELWQDPVLRARRQVVKTCETPCIQKCYLRPESDRARELLADGARLVAKGARRQVGRLLPHAEHAPDVVLRLELTDVCPCDWEGCRTPPERWRALTREAPRHPAPSGDSWGDLRDRGYLDFGRGFMGFEVVRSAIDDLRDNGLRVGVLALRWRGEPLLHPEVAPILRYLLAEAVGTVADVLRVETDGRFLTDELLAVVAQGGNQHWVVDLDRGDGAGLDALLSTRGPEVAVSAVCTAGEGTDPARWRARWPQLEPVVGKRPSPGDTLWVRGALHEHYQANGVAWASLHEAAARLAVPALHRPKGPTPCPAPATSPVISWDGKVALCPSDRQLMAPLGEVTPGSFVELWRGAERKAAVDACGARGRPDRPLCRDCGRPWGPPNL